MSVTRLRFPRLLISFFFGLLSIVLIVGGLLLFSLVQTRAAAQALRNANLDGASRAAHRALLILKPLHILTLNQPDIAVWKDGLSALSRMHELSLAGEEFLSAATHQVDTPASISEVSSHLSHINTSLQQATARLPDTWLLHQLFSSDQLQRARGATDQLSHASAVLQSLTKGQQTWIIVLQNSDEVRASGGFAGSYALVQLNDGQLVSITIEDIFDADGQFKGYVTAPSGVAEYTSSGNGLRLPDANWWPDYPQSARAMLQFFALGERNNIKGIVSINSDVIEDLLSTTGPLWLADYNTYLSAETLTTTLRTDRESFFPGSREKTELINHAFSMLKQRLSELDSETLRSLVLEIPEILSKKSVQVYAIDPNLQDYLQELKVTGEIGLHTPTDTSVSQLFLVESNVGINKSNAAISRTVDMDWNDASRMLTITIHYTHDGSYQPQTPGETTGYANYQRVLISPDFFLNIISIDDQPIADWDSETMTSSLGYELEQHGWLVPVPSSTQKATTMSFQYTGTEEYPRLLIHKQSGIQNTPYSIQSGSTIRQFTLTQDQVIRLVTE